jgi:hypothetical protein
LPTSNPDLDNLRRDFAERMQEANEMREGWLDNFTDPEGRQGILDSLQRAREQREALAREQLNE